MNVLILTPDAVGSTLLQRLITIYMQFHEYDKPVINLHELTNGLSRYYSPEFNREILNKKNTQWGYHQSLQEIVDLLDTTDHYKTSRLAQYHLVARQDPIDQQVPFYRYLDDNFFVISCRRRNVFEHALSWGINSITKKLNVYTPQEKLSSFIGLYKDGVDIDLEALKHRLDCYKDYVDWAKNNFSVASYFYYEDHLPKIEQYILNLPVFAGQKEKISWDMSFGGSFDTWNRCHFYASDIGTLALESPQEFLRLSDESGPAVPWQVWPKETQIVPVSLFNQILPTFHVDFLRTNAESYVTASESIARMVHLGILLGNLPIKKQTLQQKMHIVRNLNQCVNVYNSWVNNNPGIADTVDIDNLQHQANQEALNWKPPFEIKSSIVGQLPLSPTPQ